MVLLYCAGLILISFSTVSCCPFSCVQYVHAVQYLIHIFISYLHAICVSVYPHSAEVNSFISSSTVSCCLFLMHEIYLCIIELIKSLSASMPLVKYFYQVIRVYDHVTFALKCYR